MEAEVTMTTFEPGDQNAPFFQALPNMIHWAGNALPVCMISGIYDCNLLESGPVESTYECFLDHPNDVYMDPTAVVFVDALHFDDW